MPFDRLETPRLVIRRLAEADLPALVAYRSDPEVARYDYWGDYSLQRAQSLLALMRDREPGTPGEWFQFAVALKQSDLLIGDIGFYVDDHDPTQAEVGYRLARAYHRRGLATEAVSRVVDFAFSSLGVKQFVGYADVENERSIRLMERLGFTRIAHLLHHFQQGDEWRDDYQYSLTGDAWRRRQLKEERIGDL